MKKHIMVVDDENGVHELVGALLRQDGFAVLRAEDADAALSILEALVPDLFIVDLMMPEIDGIELCRRIRDYPHIAETPIIILSALSDPEYVTSGFEAGANAYLSKTNMHRDLLTTVHELLGMEEPNVG